MKSTLIQCGDGEGGRVAARRGREGGKGIRSTPSISVIRYMISTLSRQLTATFSVFCVAIVKMLMNEQLPRPPETLASREIVIFAVKSGANLNARTCMQQGL